MSKRDYSKVPSDLQTRIFNKLIDQRFDLSGLVEQLKQAAPLPVLSDTQKLERVRQAFGDAETMFYGLSQREDAESLAEILDLPDCLPENNDE